MTIKANRICAKGKIEKNHQKFNENHLTNKKHSDIIKTQKQTPNENGNEDEKMARLNTKSDVYYIAKMIGFKPLNLSKVYLIDDDCNEFIATVTGINHASGYISPAEIEILATEIYSSEKWATMERYIEYERAIVA